MIEKLIEERDKLSKRLQEVKSTTAQLQKKEEKISGKLERMKKKYHAIENNCIENRKNLVEIENEYSNMKQKKNKLDEEIVYSHPGEDLSSFLATASYIYDNPSTQMEIERFKNSREGSLIEIMRKLGVKLFELKKQTTLIKYAQEELTYFDKSLINKDQVAIRKELKKIEITSILLVFKGKSYRFIIKNAEDSTFKKLRNEACNYFNLYPKFYLLVDEKDRVWQRRQIVYLEHTQHRLAKSGVDEVGHKPEADAFEKSDGKLDIHVELKAKVDIKFFLDKTRYFRKTFEEFKSDMASNGESSKTSDPYRDGLTKLVDINTHRKKERKILDEMHEQQISHIRGNKKILAKSALTMQLKEAEEFAEKEKKIWHKKNAQNIMLYLLLCLFLNLSILFTKDNDQISYLKLLIHQKFLKVPFPINSNDPKTFDTISSSDDIYVWLNAATTYIIQKKWYNGDDFTRDESASLYYSNRIIGPVRVLQKRINYQKCSFESPGLNNTECLDEWAESKESTSHINITFPNSLSRNILDDSFFQEQQPTVSDINLLIATPSALSNLYSQLKDASYFNTFPNVHRTIGLFSKENKFSQSGFRILFYKENSALEIIQLSAMVARDWIDIKTRALIVNLNLYNPECDAFLAIEIIFDFHSAGKFTKSVVIKASRLYTYWQTYDAIHIVFEFCSICMVLFYLFRLARSLKQSGVKEVFSKWYNTVICLVFLLLLVKYALISSITFHGNSSLIDYSTEEYVDVMELLTFAQYIDIVEGLLCGVSILYVFRYFNRSMSIRKMWFALKKARLFLFFYFLLIVNIFLSLTYMLILVFGQYIPKYTSTASALGSIFQSVLDIFDFESHYNYDRQFTIVYFVVYLFFIKFILLNVFLAIVNDCYSSVSNETKEFMDEDQKDELNYIFKALWDLFYVIIKVPLKIVTCYIILDLITGNNKKSEEQKTRLEEKKKFEEQRQKIIEERKKQAQIEIELRKKEFEENNMEESDSGRKMVRIDLEQPNMVARRGAFIAGDKHEEV